MKVYTSKELKNLIDNIACYYSKTGDNSFDNGVNETVKEICKKLLEFEKEKGFQNIINKFFRGCFKNKIL